MSKSTSWWVWLIFGPKDTQISDTSSSWFWIQKLARPLHQERTSPPDKVRSSSGNLTTVAGSIFGPLSLTHFSKSESFYWKLIVGVAFGMSFHLNLKSQSPWSLFNGTWQKRSRKLDYRLRFEIKEMTLQIWLKETPLPGEGFLFTMFLHQEQCVRGPPSKNLVQILRGVQGSWWGNIVNRKPLRGGGFESRVFIEIWYWVSQGHGGE